MLKHGPLGLAQRDRSTPLPLHLGVTEHFQANSQSLTLELAVLKSSVLCARRSHTDQHESSMGLSAQACQIPPGSPGKHLGLSALCLGLQTGVLTRALPVSIPYGSTPTGIMPTPYSHLQRHGEGARRGQTGLTPHSLSFLCLGAACPKGRE